MLSLPLLPYSTPHPQPVCLPSLLPIHLPSPNTHHLPWTHPPRCITTRPNRDTPKKLCVFTSTAFNPPLGLSVVASPAAGEDLIRAGLLPTGTQPPELQEEAKYEPRSLPHMGIGLFVKDGKRFAPGEVILVDHPTLMVPVSDGDRDKDRGAVVEELSWQGVMQLPTKGRGLTRGLARGVGRLGDDELVDVVDTNAFSQVKGGRGWNLVFPRAAVSFLSFWGVVLGGGGLTWGLVEDES